jgi:hypothetical protein
VPEHAPPAFDAYCHAVFLQAFQDRGHPDATLNLGWLQVLQFALVGQFSYGETAAELLRGKTASDATSRLEIALSEDLVRRLLVPHQLSFLATEAKRAAVPRAVVIAGWLKHAMQQRMAATSLRPESMQELFGG